MGVCVSKGGYRENDCLSTRRILPTLMEFLYRRGTYVTSRHAQFREIRLDFCVLGKHLTASVRKLVCELKVRRGDLTRPKSGGLRENCHNGNFTVLVQ